MRRSPVWAALLLASAALAPLTTRAASPCEPSAARYRPRPFKPAAGAGYLTADGAVRIVGYNDMAPMVGAWNTAFAAAHPGVRFAADLSGTRTAPPALIEGRSAFAPMGAEFTPQNLAAFRAATGAAPLEFRVAHDSLDPRALSGPLGLMVARDNPLRSISLDRVAQVFAGSFGEGRMATWGQLGLTGAWATQPIRLLGLAPQTALAQVLRAKAFPGRDYAPAVVGFGHSADVVGELAGDPGALAFAAVNLATPRVRVLALSAGGKPAVLPTAANLRAERYPLDRQLLIYTRAPLDPLVREYLRLALSCEGQAMVGAGGLGYLPLSAAEARRERRKLK